MGDNIVPFNINQSSRNKICVFFVYVDNKETKIQVVNRLLIVTNKFKIFYLKCVCFKEITKTTRSINRSCIIKFHMRVCIERAMNQFTNNNCDLKIWRKLFEDCELVISIYIFFIYLF